MIKIKQNIRHVRSEMIMFWRRTKQRRGNGSDENRIHYSRHQSIRPHKKMTSGLNTESYGVRPVNNWQKEI